jgi:Dolichyl-phosphate-mannose-protein mannosyltransferase
MTLPVFIRNHHKTIFYLSWLTLNLIQAARTGLLDDEAYYWVYSRFLDWGYFDHPPMIAVLIRAGYAIFPNELGVRLFIVLMSTATLCMIQRLAGSRNDKQFYLIAASMFLLQIGSIIAVPDLPLLFFIALFYLVYERFLQKADLLTTITLGFVISAMLYSKYHAVMIIFFTLLSNPKLFLKWQTWTAASLATVLFMPHLWWQYTHGFPSVKYHLIERNATIYQSSFTTEYLSGQILLAGPLIGWILLWGAFAYKPTNFLDKALKWGLAGIYILFLLSTFKGRSEANWTVPAFVGLIALSHKYLNEKPRLSIWINRLFLPALLVILAARIYMMLDVKPLAWIKKDEFHKTKEWAQAILKKADGLPVVFMSSYQRASQYWFYTGDSSYALNSIYYRRNNYNFWPLEQRLQQKKVYVLSPDDASIFPDSIITERKYIGARTVEPFFSFAAVQITGVRDLFCAGSMLTTRISIENENGEAGNHNQPDSNERSVHDSAKIYLAIYNKDNEVGYSIPSNITVGELLQNKSMQVTINLSGIKPRKYRCKWAIGSCIPGYPSLNSTSISLEINHNY